VDVEGGGGGGGRRESDGGGRGRGGREERRGVRWGEEKRLSGGQGDWKRWEVEGKRG